MEKNTLGPFFTQEIILAIFLGVIVGNVIVGISYDVDSHNAFRFIFESIGMIFLSLLKVLVIPVVFISLTAGIASMPGAHKLATTGLCTIGLYTITTALAVSLAIGVAHFFHIGYGTGLALNAPVSEPVLGLSYMEVIADFFPTNIILSMSEGNMIHIVVFASLFGVAILQSGAAGKRFARHIEDFHKVLMSLVLMVIRLAPIGVFALISSAIIHHGLFYVGAMGQYFATVIMVLCLHVLVVYGTLLAVFGKRSIIGFIQDVASALSFAFSVSSSVASIPVVLSVVKEKLHVGDETASFVIPLGATMNMDGTAIMQGVATVFLAQVYGVDLTMHQYVVVVLLAVMASVGTAGIPGAGLLTLSMVLNEVGIPLEGIALIVGVDRVLDMLRTSVNILGDCIIAVVVEKRVRAYKAVSSHRYVSRKKAATTSL